MRRVIAGAAAAFLLVTSSAVLAEDDGVTVSLRRNGAQLKLEGLNEPVLDPDVIRRPSSGQTLKCIKDNVVSRPAELKGRKVAGFSSSVLLICRVSGDRLAECQAVASKRAVGLGFTDAAMCVAGHIKVAPKAKSGEAVEGRLVGVDLQLWLEA